MLSDSVDDERYWRLQPSVVNLDRAGAAPLVKKFRGTTRPARYGAAVIDSLLAFFSLVAVGDSLSSGLDAANVPGGDVAIGLGVSCVYFLYFFVFEWLLGATPGKFFTGLKVCRTDGSACGAKGALLRTLTRLIEVNPLLLGALPAALIIHRSELRQRWGDMLADTVVVEAGGRR